MTVIAEKAALIRNLVSEYAQARDGFRTAQEEMMLWKQRMDDLVDVDLELRPVDAAEAIGQYSKKLFPVLPLLKQIQGKYFTLPDALVRSDSKVAERLEIPDIRTITLHDKSLRKALVHLEGMEPALIAQMRSVLGEELGLELGLGDMEGISGDDEQNMVVWALLKVSARSS